jgi:hypothetical protein
MMWRPVLSLALLLGLAGCGASKPVDPDEYSESDRIGLTLTNLEDARNSPARLAEYFAAGSALPSRDRLGKLSLRMKGPAEVIGDSATAVIELDNEEDGGKVGEVTWSFVKVGGHWKVKEAPLP